MNTSGNPHRADWYPDPSRRFEYRYFNGERWTADVSLHGSRYVDPASPASSGTPTGGDRPIGHHRDGLATTALVLGVVGLTLSWVPVLFAAGAACSVIAVVFGVVARRRTPRDTRGFAGAGILTGAAGVALVGVGVWTTSRVFDVIDAYDNPPPSVVELTACTIDGGTVAIAGGLTNRGDESSRYRVAVRVDVPGLTARTVSIDVGTVDAGATERFSGRLPLGGSRTSGAPTCRVQRVTGPLPFGLDLDG